MKKTSYVLLVAALLGLAPSAFAADGAALSFDGLFARLVAIFSGLGEEAEMGSLIEPFGQPVAAEPPGTPAPPNSSAGMGEQLEMGWQIEPGG